ncbi:hypothetical protein NLU13_0326 [Sarocladium strictum]|uniref:Uncharacterized protein n=1 Tax=Sarocladium strictum TaxID=5046 RepID=A0AA39GQB5_SARSR|nr:hypothetical protein NLU13_0326 [Sarocladium strictum]
MATLSEAMLLEDELNIQRVILSSLDGATFEGAESERIEAREEIVKLQQRLKSLRAGAHSDRSSSQRNGESSDTGNGLRHGSQQHVAGPSQDEARLSTPSTPKRQQDSQEMDTVRSGNDIWTGSGSLASRNRKRYHDNSSLGVKSEHQNKSRRTTPTPRSSGFRSPFSTQGSEVIDLTGVDDGDDATDYLLRQKREEDLRAQERRDLEYALAISSGDDMPSLGRATSSRATAPNALQHLMNAQRANAYAPGRHSADEMPSATQFSPEGIPSLHSRQSSGPVTPSDLTPRLPGAYDPSWDEVRTTGAMAPAEHRSYLTRPSPYHGSHGHQSPVQQVAHGPIGPTRVLPNGHTSGIPGSYSQFMQPWMAPGMSNMTPVANSQWSPHASPGTAAAASPVRSPATSGIHPRLTRADMPSWSGFRRQMMSGTLSGTLSNIISQTSGYDFANRTDAFGNPLPPHIASYLDDTDPYADPEMTARELEELLQNIEPEVQVPKGLQGITPDALTTPLYKHQEVALTWMKKMEDGTNKGGILADDMGLGKTISTLALIHERKSPNRPKTNLIIAPVALMHQWKDEILRKTKPSHRLSVFVHHGRKSTSDQLMGFDVVLTTYGTLAAELKRYEKWVEKHAGRDLDFNDSDLAIKCPLLHPTKAKFHRVILDEAQCIKNKDTQTAKACHQLRAQYRWCLTGTPMMNGVVELYSLLKFLQIRPYNAWNSFRQSFGVLFGKQGDSKSTAMRRLRVLLKAILLRRKKNSLIDGKPIVELPEKTEEVTYAELSTDERDFYSQLESKSQVIFNKYLREGSVGKNYANVLVLLLRLRQACCHPHLNLDVDDIAPDVDDDMLDRVKRLDNSTVNRIKQIDAFECPVCYDAMTSPAFFFPCGHDCCRPCLTQLVDNATQNNIQAGNESSKAQCIACRSEFDPKECFSIEAFQEIHMPEEKIKTSDIKPSMLKALRKESFKNRTAYRKYMAYLRETWLPSAKVDDAIRLLKQFEVDGQKTIVFSQWTLLLDLIEVAMGHEFDEKPLRYDGSMSAIERANAAQDFRDKRSCKVMLVSLRAGNAGLNLTAASRVIIMDPFWNPYIEMQAVDRAYRIGQKNEVKVYRILTKQTVEDRIVELQERKKEMVEAALDENAGKQLGRLSVAELRYLFTGR